ncbi:MAG: arginine--tRNA ligase [Chloroflexi bacterium]|nr:arginine--tRNA ligase [Chloroflexota bacterium]
MARDELAGLIERAALAAQARGLLPDVKLPEFTVEPPTRAEHGDYATNLAMRLARAARMAPTAIAATLIQSLPANDVIARAEVAGAGFINLTLNPQWVARRIAKILEMDGAYGNNSTGGGRRVQIEFVSANPTGPLHAASGRAASLGAALGNLLRASGWQVELEYYVNDAGSRLAVFGESILARYLAARGVTGPRTEVPKEGYLGEYVTEYATHLAAEHGDRFEVMAIEDAIPLLARMGAEHMIERHRADMAALGIEFDVWFREQSLHDSGDVTAIVDELRQRGHVADRDGAVWFQTTALGDDRDNVLVRSNGTPGYMTADIAYHRNKFITRGFDKVIDIWGADHQGHVGRMKASMQAIDLDPERLTILLHQMVVLRRGAEVVTMSKRQGNIIALSDVIEEVGPDACRFFFLTRSADSQMDFDLELAKRQAADNPVYYVQYSHARTSSILQVASSRGIDPPTGADAAPYSHPGEIALVRFLIHYPQVVADAATDLEPHRLTFAAQELASLFNAFYRDCRVLPSDHVPLDTATVRSRLLLVAATRAVLAHVLSLIGVSAPDRMDRSDEPTE